MAAPKKKCPPCECEPGLPLWLGTFGDLMSLLLTFFILLLSMASFDAKKLTEAEGSMRGALSVLPGGLKLEPGVRRNQQRADITPEPETAPEANRIENTVMEFQEMMKVAQGPANSVGEGSEGFLIRLPAGVLFKEGGTKVETDDGLLFLKRMTEVINRLPKNVQVEVRGHADTLPVSDQATYKDKLYLTAMRALSVSRILVSDGIDPERITTVGRGDQEPLTTSKRPEDQEKNRRVDIYLYAKEMQSSKTPTVLDQTNPSEQP